MWKTTLFLGVWLILPRAAASPTNAPTATQLTNALPAIKQAPVPEAVLLTPPLVKAPAKPEGSKVVVGGAIPKVARSKSFWQMFNPFAPREYGNGEENVNRDLLTGRAQGVTLLSFSFPSPAPKKAKHPPAAAPAAPAQPAK